MDGRHRAYIGVGSNLGNRVENCRRAIEALAASEDCVLEAQSPFYETEPLYLEDQDWFVNAAALIRTSLAPEALLARLQAIEQKMGPRGESPRFGPRVLDLDILFFDDLVLQRGDLNVPHPRLHERRFVLRPLSDIAARFVHPVLGETVGSLLASLKDGRKRVLLLE
ncbi:MAG: 2-amino-4-hydroxy-6-hydroxymethyldihydropteridine diphosphokinase [Thermodesulfobacteriota bacterium]|nr:2-amino-4-hydroxy-6-hydroxymethyldihydropteridine diphosphokinase [Thermodesulfobacteriota bacterium]